MGVLTDRKLEELRAAKFSERGNRLDLAIRLSGIPQRHIAHSLKIPVAAFSAIKTGQRRKVPLDLANKIGDYFGCSPTDLFPPGDVIVGLSIPDLVRPLVRPKTAFKRRAKRLPRKRPELVYPLAGHLEKQILAIFQMLTDARVAQRMTLQELGDKLDRTRQQIEQWESAMTHLRVDSLAEWADALGYRLFIEPIRAVAVEPVPQVDSGDSVNGFAHDKS